MPTFVDRIVFKRTLHHKNLKSRLFVSRENQLTKASSKVSIVHFSKQVFEQQMH